MNNAWKDPREDEGYYIRIPFVVVEMKNISLLSKMVFGLLDGASTKEGFFYGTNKWMAKRLLKDSTTIQRCLAELKEADLIEIVIENDENGRFLERRIYPLRTFHTPHRRNAATPTAETRPPPPQKRGGSYTTYSDIKINNICIEEQEKTSFESTKRIQKRWNEWTFSSSLKNPPSQIKQITSSRSTHLKARQKEGFTIDAILEALSKSTDWLNTWPNFSFDWLIVNDTNWIKVVEGKFFDKSQPKMNKQKIEVKDKQKYKNIKERKVFI